MAEKKLTIRLPESVHALLVRLAERDQRSLNGEIVYLLRQLAEQEDQARRGSARKG